MNAARAAIRKIFLASAILLIFAAGELSYGEVVTEAARSFTLKEAMDTAVMNNRSIQIQLQEIEFAKANILDAKSAFLPQVSAGYDFTYTGAVPTSSEEAGKRKDSRIFTGYKSDNALKVSFDESIYNGGANIANLEQARLGLKVQDQTLRATRLEIEFETKRLFYGLLLAYETRRIAQDLIEQAQAHYEKVQKMYGQGTTSKFDVLQSKVQVSRLIPQLVNADNAIDLIMVEFKKLLVLSLKDPIRIDGELEYSLIEIKEDEFLDEAYKNQPQMILKLLGIDVQKWAIEFAKAGWLPQISATGSYIYNSDDVGNMINPRHDNWNVGISASIALFDGFATKAKVDEAKARYTQAYLQKDDIIDRIAVDIKNACLNMKEAKAVIDSQKDSIEEAKEALRLSEVRYINGVGINLDVLDAQVALAQVEQNLAQGIYDYLMAAAQLVRTMGRECMR